MTSVGGSLVLICITDEVGWYLPFGLCEFRTVMAYRSGVRVCYFSSALREKKPRNYWKEKERQREFLEALRGELGLNSVGEWATIPTQKIVQNGGSFLLRLYPSFQGALQEIYPEENWGALTTRLPRNYWSSKENIKKFFDDLAVKLDLKTEEDWNAVSVRTIKENGGSGILQKNPSLFDILSDVYPEKDWWKSGLQRKIPRKFWENTQNQRKFLDKLASHLKLENKEQWRSVTVSDIINNGGGRLLEIYPTIIDLLNAVYPEYDWNLLTPSLSNDINNSLPLSMELEEKTAEEQNLTTPTLLKTDSYGLNIKRICPQTGEEITASDNLQVPVLPPRRLEQRLWMDKLAKRLHISSYSDWNGLKMETIIENGGYDIAKEYPTLSAALRQLYPEFQWSKIPQIRQTPHEYWKEHWKNQKNQKNFLLQLEKELNIQTPKDWIYVSESKVKQYGGYGLLFYHSSLSNALRELFPEYDWSDLPEKTQEISIWSNPKYQRGFLDRVAATLNIVSTQDWKSVSVQQVKALGGSQLLRQYPSLSDALQALYPEHKLTLKDVAKRIPPGYWNNSKNQKNFLDSIASKYNLTTAKDWANFSIRTLRSLGAGALIRLHGSYYGMLRNIYPEYNWDFFLDHTERLPEFYWIDPANVRSFVKYFEQKKGITSKEDWTELSESAITDEFGGSALLAKYGTPMNILKIAFPDEAWDSTRFLLSTSRSSLQKRLFTQIEKIFPDIEVIQKSGQLQINGKKMKLLAFIPSMHLGIKFHGKVDYRSLGPQSSLDMYDNFDKEVVDAYRKHGIKLVIVRCWDDWSPKSLRSLIISEYPELDALIPSCE